MLLVYSASFVRFVRGVRSIGLVAMALVMSSTSADAQLVTVRFEARVTSTYASTGIDNPPVSINNYLPSPVQNGDTIVGYVVYDLAVTSDSEPSNAQFGIYNAATVCGGFTVGGTSVQIIGVGEDPAGNVVNIRNNVFGPPNSDQFTMRASQDENTYLATTAGYHHSSIDLAVYTNRTSPDPTVVTTDAMQVMPVTGWNNIYFSWSERSGDTQIGITGDHVQPFQVTVSGPGEAPPCNLAPPPNTGAGKDVSVMPAVPDGTPAISLTFDFVDAAGETTVLTGAVGPAPPSGFKLTNPSVNHEITTTAQFTGRVRICLGWTPGQIGNEGNVSLFHHDGNHWVDVTDPASRDTVKNNVCGIAGSLSPFALFEVKYPFTGFFAPVESAPTVNAVKAGVAVPVKFSLGSDLGLNIFTAGFPRTQLTPCDATAVIDEVTETVTAGGSSLSYDASTGRYTYVWKTEKAWGGSCRELQLKLTDGEVYRARFTFRK